MAILISDKVRNAAYAAIYGDIIGSVQESRSARWNGEVDIAYNEEYGRFTDDSVLTIATLEALKKDLGFFENYKKWGNRYKFAGYGTNFRENILTGIMCERESNSSANGCIMRASPLLALDINNPDDYKLIQESVLCTHNHPDSMFAFTAYYEFAKKENIILPNVWSFDDFKFAHGFDITAVGTVRDAISVYKKAEGAVENCGYLSACFGGDTDTVGAISCSLAGYRNGVSDHVKEVVRKKITGEMLEVLEN